MCSKVIFFITFSILGLSIYDATGQCAFRIINDMNDPCCKIFNTGDQPGDPGEYIWDYGDGTTGNTPSHCYDGPGTYSLVLTVGNTVCVARKITISTECVNDPPPPPPSCGTPTTPPCPQGCSSIIIWPNPVSEEFGNIKFRFEEEELNNGNYNYQIINSVGNVISSGTSSTSSPISINGFAGGNYVLRVVCSNGQSVSTQFIVTRDIAPPPFPLIIFPN